MVDTPRSCDPVVARDAAPEACIRPTHQLCTYHEANLVLLYIGGYLSLFPACHNAPEAEWKKKQTGSTPHGKCSILKVVGRSRSSPHTVESGGNSSAWIEGETGEPPGFRLCISTCVFITSTTVKVRLHTLWKVSYQSQSNGITASTAASSRLPLKVAKLVAMSPQSQPQPQPTQPVHLARAADLQTSGGQTDGMLRQNAITDLCDGICASRVSFCRQFCP